jgi:multidrug efflux pump
MSLFELFVRRPVLSTVLSLLVMLIGIVSYGRLTVREYPNIDEPIVSVRTDYRGASAEIIETQVTQILENSIAGIEGVEILSSTSRQERSITRCGSDRMSTSTSRPPTCATASAVRNRMPDEIDEPVIAKVEADPQPILYLS